MESSYIEKYGIIKLKEEKVVLNHSKLYYV